jgi:phosphoglycerate dehydrogenase-like enzyme
MPEKGFSRRNFLRNVTAGSAGAAVAALPGARPTLANGAAPEPPWPLTVESFPLAAPGKAPNLAPIKLVTQDRLSEAHQERVRAISSNLEWRPCGSQAEFHREVRDAHVILGDFSRDDFAAAGQLKWIQYTAAGVEHILWPEVVESPVVLTNMQRIYSPTISETAIGLLLTLNRGLHRYALQTRERRWKPVPGLREISGITMGIVGLGGIGTDTAYRAHYGFGIKILAVDPKPLPKPTFVAELHALDWLPKMVPQVDVLLSAAPDTKVSEGMFNESVFRAMKPTAYFINVSRGKLVDKPALVRALQEGWIAGAALDVTDPEPLPADDPLWTAGNIIITSHSSAHSEGSTQRANDLFCENVRRYVNGLPLLNVVDKRRGY